MAPDEDPSFMQLRKREGGNELNIQLDFPKEIKVRVAVRNKAGKAVKSYGFMNLEPGRGISLDISNLEAGNYTAIITDQDAFEYSADFSKR